MIMERGNPAVSFNLLGDTYYCIAAGAGTGLGTGEAFMGSGLGEGSGNPEG